jgi:integrase
MTGCTFKRKLKSGTSWGFSFFIGRDENGKPREMFRSGFATKGAAAGALKIAIAEHEAKHGKVIQERSTHGRRWKFILGDQEQAFTSKAAAERGLEDAIAHRAERAAESAAAAEARKALTFGRYFQIYIDEHAVRRCAPKTIERYRELGRYLITHLGATPINELTTAQIQRTVHELQDRGGAQTKDFPNGRPLSAKTVRHIATLLYTALAEADRLGFLTVPHPMANKRVKMPKLVRREPPVLDPAKLGALFERARGARLYPFLVLAADSGCRRGELLAATWSDLNATTGELSVSKSIEQTKKGLRVKSTKSGKPRRIGLSDWALETLVEHRKIQDRDREMFGTGYEKHDLIFCQPTGAYYSPDRVGARVVEMMRAAGLEGVSLHSLRHSSASIALSGGVPLAVVSERLGHADQNITLSIYSHAMPADKRAATKGMDQRPGRRDFRLQKSWAEADTCGYLHGESQIQEIC